jgi:Tetratricopeptide repeat
MTARLDHPLTTVIYLDFAMWVHYYRGDVSKARANAQSMISLAAAHGFSGQVDDGPVILRCTASSESQADEPIGVLYRRVSGVRPGLSAWRNILCLCVLARAAAARGDVSLGLEIMAAIPEEHRGTFMAPEIERIRGELLLRRGDSAAAEPCFRRALEIARRRAERSLELRAAMSLARLLRRAGASDEAQRTLGEVHGGFTQGFDTADLREARALIDELTDPSTAAMRRR